jgi:hypothetical protein
MKFKYIILFIFFAGGFSGCATTAKLELALDSWIGSSEDSLIESWGAPQRSYKMSSGKKIVEYIKGRSVPIGGWSTTVPETTYHTGSVGNTTYDGMSTTYKTETSPVTILNFSCKTSFIIDVSGQIETWRYEGNNCVSR